MVHIGSDQFTRNPPPIPPPIAAEGMKFYLGTHTRKDELINLYAQVWFRNRRTRFFLPIKISRRDWNQSRQEVRRTNPHYASINKYLSEIQSKVQSFLTKATIEGAVVLNKEEIIQEVLGHSFSTDSFVDLFDRFIDEKAEMVRHGTLKRYRSLRSHVEAFTKDKFSALRVRDINKKFVSDFVQYFRVDAQIADGTTSKYIGNLKSILMWCEEIGHSVDQTVKNVSVKQTSQERFSLTWEEFKLIEQLNLVDKPRLDRVRDLFCFGCYTGQRFGDILKLKDEDIVDGIWDLRTEKTNSNIQVPLVSQARDILKKYKQLPTPLPQMSNQKANMYLKELAALAGIDRKVKRRKTVGARTEETVLPAHKHISFHDARRTFVTLMREKGVEADLITKITGHKDYKTFQLYNAIGDERVKRELEGVFE